MAGGLASKVRRVGAALVLASAGALAGGCSHGDATAVVYASPSLEPELLDWAAEAFHVAHPEAWVRFVVLPDDQVLRELRALAGDASGPGDVDVWWGAPSWRMAQAAQEGFLGNSGATWASRVPEELKDPAGMWVGTFAEPLVLAFNADSLSRSRAPRDWIDLVHPRWSGELIIPEPGPVDGLTVLMLQHMWDAFVRYGDADQGLDWFARLDAWRESYPPSAEEAARRLRSGHGLVAILPLPAAEACRVAGACDYRVPETATPVLVRGVGLLAQSSHAESARAFLEWLGSDDAVAGWARRTARLPAVDFPGGPAGAVGPWAARVVPGMIPAFVPADSVAPQVDAWVERWHTDVKGRAASLF